MPIIEGLQENFQGAVQAEEEYHSAGQKGRIHKQEWRWRDGIGGWGPSAAKAHAAPSPSRELSSGRRAPNDNFRVNRFKSLTHTASFWKPHRKSGVGTRSIGEVQPSLHSASAAITEWKLPLLKAPFKLSETSTIEMKSNTQSSAAENAEEKSSEGCIHPEEMRVWDSQTGEEICGRCGEVISCEPVLVPKIKHNEKLQSHLNRTKLSIGTLPPESRTRTEITATNIVDKLCFDLALPKYVLESAVVHAQRILRACRKAPHRLTLREAAVAGIICACKESGHPYSLKRIAETTGRTPNSIYRLLARISRFYGLPHRIIPAEHYIGFIGARLSAKLKGKVNTHYLSLAEQYACMLLRAEKKPISASPLHAAAEALAAADERMANRIGRKRIAEVIGAAANGSFMKNVNRLKSSRVPPPAGAMRYFIGLRRMWK